MNSDSANLCDQLDAYVDGDLPTDERQAFVAHLAHCPECREATDQQRWIDALLQSDEAAALEWAPTLLLRRRTSRRVLLAVAAALAALAAWPLLPLPRREGLGEGRPTPPSISAPELIATTANPSPNPSLPGRGISDPRGATFASNSRTIAVPIPAFSPEVTIVRLYPVLKPTGAASAHGG